MPLTLATWSCEFSGPRAAYFLPSGAEIRDIGHISIILTKAVRTGPLGYPHLQGAAVRVIAGEARGFTLKGPAGPGTRPMADKIKGALFSMLASLGVEPERVLDLYAGTGSVGIEALSRGAEHAVFVEQNAAAARVVRANLAHTKFTDRAQVIQQPVQSYLRHAATTAPTGQFDLVIMDPPYADPEIIPTLEQVGASPLVQSGAIVVIGHSPRVTLPERAGNLERLRERCHGDSCFSIYERIDDAANDDRPGAGMGAEEAG